MISSSKRTSENIEASSSSKKPKLITDFFQRKTVKKVENKSTVNDSQNETKVTSKESESGTLSSEEKSKELATHASKPQGTLMSSFFSSESTSTSKYASEEEEYADFCHKHNFDMEKWVNSLTPEQKDLLDEEIKYLHVTWLAFLHKTVTQPYFLKLKRFLRSQAEKTVFPPKEQIYSWSHYTPLPRIRCIVLGQDPYHNYRQAHGLAFSVLEPTRPPPSLVNIYKALSLDYPEFVTPDYNQLARQGKPGGGNLTKWAKNGVLLLNAVLTVECHKANSHAQQGWETFTEEVLRTAINYYKSERNNGFVIMAWGSPAQNRIKSFAVQLKSPKFLVLRTVHPSPLSAHRGFFDSHVFKKCNDWLGSHGHKRIDWGLIDGNVVM
ncbi:Piso0_002056 [Millerozyma farinosa CBS 7064]|uniref:Uracil-DNA glycosylase n=1 Tax=Pichia sorbitophila (strain ATCC MYA-4447 / BCRC 22081 / CBS 7064 / NBRC 10061 / NRRL Y-12695) TaxID=559304 RepID=G8YE02_PICSO|nr:Piso0_002056 [Millerozyma farinosa CBS 7064]